MICAMTFIRISMIIVIVHVKFCYTGQDKHTLRLRSVASSISSDVLSQFFSYYYTYRDLLDPDTSVLYYLQPETNQTLLRWTNMKDRLASNSIDFGIIDQDLNATEKIENPDLKTLIFLTGTLLFPFNVPGVNFLRFTNQLIADVFYGTITTWNHPSIVSLNPNVTLPNAKIKIVARLDQTLHTQWLTSSFSTISPMWKLTRGTFNDPQLTSDGSWSQAWKKNATDIFFVKKTTGVAAVVSSIPYTISYVHSPMAVKWNLSTLSFIYNPNYYNLTGAALEYNKVIMNQTEYIVNDVFMETGINKLIVADPTIWIPLAFPFFYFNFIIFNQTIQSDEQCRKIIEILLLVNWVLTDPSVKVFATELDLVPLPDKAIDLIKVYVLDNITCANEKTYDKVKSMLKKKEVANIIPVNNGMDPAVSTTLEVMVPVVVILVILFGCYYYYQRYRLRQEVNAKNWLIPEHDIKFTDSINEEMSVVSFRKSLDAVTVDERMQKGKSLWDFHWYCRCRYKLKQVIIFKSSSKRNPLTYKYETCKRLYTLMKSTKSANVADLLGLFIQDNTIYHVYDHFGKGSLHGILAYSPYDLNEDIKYMLAKDVATGVLYLHKHGVIHGLLDSWNVHLDNNWSAKVTNWAHNVCCDLEGDTSILMPSPEVFNETIDNDTYKRLLYRHPDLLAGHDTKFESKHDLYSFAMILIEVFTRETPFQESFDVVGSVRQVFDEVIVDRKIPISRPDIPGTIKDIIQQMTRPNPQISFDGVIMYLTMHQPTNKGIVDTLLEAMENYMQTLEEKVEERTGELKLVTQKMENLLVSMLPKDVAAKLQNGEVVQPEFYSSVTIFFSDVVSFTSLCGESTPLEVITFLNGLYTMFDNVIEQYDAYKVETIGDAYMCVSGLPNRNGIMHVEEICKMALALVESTKSFTIMHRKERKLQIRVGINSGPVMSGVVGVKMPRYCLFGDTVNTASRMESTSMPNKIQITESTVTLLHNFPQFAVEQRGVLEVKGKGVMKTYWLNDCASLGMYKAVALEHL